MNSINKNTKEVVHMSRVNEIYNTILLDYQKEMVDFMRSRSGVLHYADM